MNKKSIRINTIIKRDALTDAVRSYQDSHIMKSISKLYHANTKQFQKIGLYIGNKFEAETSDIIRFFNEHRSIIAIPNIASSKNMTFKMINSVKDDIFFDQMGIGQAKTTCQDIVPDTIIMPLIACDQYLNRIGSGYGYYDKYLEKYPNIYKIGIGYDVQLIEKIEHEKHDVKMDIAIIGDKIIYNTKSRRLFNL